jgi:hypothetical protein
MSTKEKVMENFDLNRINVLEKYVYNKNAESIKDTKNPYYNPDADKKTAEAPKEPWFGTLGNGQNDGWKDVVSALALPLAILSPTACTKQPNTQPATEATIQAAKRSVDLSNNNVINFWGPTDPINYSVQGNTLTIQATDNLLQLDDIGKPHVVGNFAFGNGIKTNGHTKLVLTCLEKSGEFLGSHNIGFAIEEQRITHNIMKADLIAPAGWNIVDGFIANKQEAPAGNYYYTLQAGDELEFDISGKPEIYIGGYVIEGNNGKLVFSFELRD